MIETSGWRVESSYYVTGNIFCYSNYYTVIIYAGLKRNGLGLRYVRKDMYSDKRRNTWMGTSWPCIFSLHT